MDGDFSIFLIEDIIYICMKIKFGEGCYFVDELLIGLYFFFFCWKSFLNDNNGFL